MNQNESLQKDFILPDDLIRAVHDLSQRLGASPRQIVIAAVEHLTRIPEEQRKAILKGTSLRRGW
jgi:hypothetical protein